MPLTNIYCATDPNGRRYIGQTSGPLRRRVSGHMSAAKRGHNNPKFGEALLKYGDKMKWAVVARVPEFHANIAEQQLIVVYGAAVPNGYNVRRRGSRLTQDHRDKISRSSQGVPKTELHRKRIGDSHRGRTGASCPEVAQANKERVWTAEMREKSRQSHAGKQHTPEARKRMSEVRALYWARKRGEV